YVVIFIARTDRSGSPSRAPSSASTSDPRARRKLALEVVAGPAALSLTRTRTPWLSNPQAAARPAGPAPTTRTSDCLTEPTLQVRYCFVPECTPLSREALHSSHDRRIPCSRF